MISALLDDKWIIAGGSSTTDSLYNDTNMFSFTGMNWVPYESVELPTRKGNAPAAVMGGQIYVPGGIDRTCPRRPAGVFPPFFHCLGGGKWPRLTAANGPSSPLSPSLLLLLDQRGVVIAAVFDNELYSASSGSVLTLQPDENEWKTALKDNATRSNFGISGSYPYERQGHSAVTLISAEGDEVIVTFGGVNTFSFVFFDDLWSLHNGGRLWTPISLASRPPPMSATNTVRVLLPTANVAASVWIPKMLTPCVPSFFFFFFPPVLPRRPLLPSLRLDHELPVLY